MLGVVKKETRLPWAPEPAVSHMTIRPHRKPLPWKLGPRGHLEQLAR